MGKSKTKKAVKKRIKVTAGGKLIHAKAGRSHLMRKKTSRQRLHLKKKAIVDTVEVKKIKRMLKYS